MKPLISVVIATYNASHLLRHAIASVRLQDRSDWEIIVVSDHSPDDTESVVASFGDDRIRFVDLPRNSGQQATPNNVGVRAACGDYLAFLNQDDLYLPDHLSSSLAFLNETGADLVCCPCAQIMPEQAARIAAREIVARADCFELTGRFSPYTFHVASSWFLRRATALAVGPWRLERETWVTPSQDWLFRAWRAGARIRCSERISVVLLYSGLRRDSYRKRDSREHEFVFAETIASDRLRPALRAAAERWIADAAGPEFRRRRRRLRSFRKLVLHVLRSAIHALLSSFGVHPLSLTMRRRFGARGGFIAELKKFTG